MKKRVQAGWNEWRRMSGVICDRRVPARIKGKVYKVAVRPAMLSGLETAALTKRQEAAMEVAELKMLRFSLGVHRCQPSRNRAGNPAFCLISRIFSRTSRISGIILK